MTALTGRRLEAIILTMADRVHNPTGIEKRDITGALEWATEKLAQKTAVLAQKWLAASAIEEPSTEGRGLPFRMAYVRYSGGVTTVVLGYWTGTYLTGEKPPSLQEYEFDVITLFRCFDGRAPITTITNKVNETRPNAKVLGLSAP